MADRKQKDSTPPPLLLMPASEGLTLSPNQGGSLLMPVPQTEPSLFQAEEDGEVDSFIGQGTPPQAQLPTQGPPLGYFQLPGGAPSDPFAQVRQPGMGQMAPPPQSQQIPMSAPQGVPLQPPMGGPPRGPPPGGMMTPPRGPSQDFHRHSGPLRYAQPPPGTYAPPGQQGPPLGMGQSPAGAPPPTSISMQGAPPPIGGPPPMGSPPPMVGPPPMGGPPQMGLGPSPPSFPSPAQMGPGPGIPHYLPVQHHWYYCQPIELKFVWKPFTILDSLKLEEAFKSGHQDNVIVSTDGGRFDVDVIEKTRTPVYWEDQPTKVRRCSWFYKPEGDNKFVPYEEDFAQRLEEEYKNAMLNNVWHKRLEFDGGETIVMHNPNVIVHFRASAQPDEWGTTPGDQFRPRVVKRGVDDFDEIADGEPSQVDHLVFVVHGIGSTCDLRFRSIIECVDDFRDISLQLMQSHFRTYQDEGRVGRVEFLPVRWHSALHGDATGVDRKLKAITLGSIGKLRHFTNDTLLDILFYASPTYAQQIADTVVSEMNRLYHLFLTRNSAFQGKVSVSGHSLGSLVLFDLLVHQRDPAAPSDPEPATQVTPGGQEQQEIAGTDTQEQSEEGKAEEQEEAEPSVEELLASLGLSDYLETFNKEKIDMETLTMCAESDIKELGLPMGPRKKLQGFLKDRQQKQARKKEEAEQRLKRELELKLKREQEEKLSQQAQQQAQEIASRHPLLQSASNTSVSFVVGVAGTGIPFVKYPQLDFSPVNFFALGSPIAMFLTVRGVDTLGENFKLPTCPGFFNVFHPFDPVAYRLEPLLSTSYSGKPVLMPHHKGRKRLHLELKDSLSRVGADIKQRIIDSVKSTWKSINDFAMAHRTTPEMVEEEVETVLSQMTREEEEKAETGSMTSSVVEEEPIGNLNQGRRVDYVLQEKPIESFNDYLFALGSHACYWESEDTVLMILKETYALMGIAAQKPGQELLASPPRPQMPPSLMASPPGGAPPLGHGPPPGPPPPGAMSSPYRPPHQGAGQPPFMGTPQNMGPPPSQVGPPPLSGFVRSTPKS